MGLPGQLLPFSQINSGSGPNRGRKGNSDREAGREHPARVPNAARASKTAPPNRAPRNALMAGGFDMAVTSRARCWEREKENFEKGLLGFFFFPTTFLLEENQGENLVY